MPFSELVWLVTVVVVLGSIVKITYTVLLGPLAKLPGPFHTRFTGIVLLFNTIRGRRIFYVQQLHEQYGPLVRLTPDEVAVTALEDVKTIHKIGNGFMKSDFYLKFNENVGVFAMTDASHHAARRRLLAQSFSKTNLVKWNDLVVQRARLAVSLMLKEMKQEGQTDVLKWWTFMATDVIGELSFGESFRMLEQRKKNAYISDLEKVMMVSGVSVALGKGFVKLLALLPIPALRDFPALQARLKSYGTESIRRHKPLSDDEIEIEASNFIVAGSDTTAVTLTYLTWAVLGHPDIRAKIEQEISEVGPEPSLEALENLKWLNAAIVETLRLYGAAPGMLPRVTPAKGANFHGQHIPPGTVVVTQSYSLHRDAFIFSEPNKWRPERWFNPTAEMKDAYMPFGVGGFIWPILNCFLAL